MAIMLHPTSFGLSQFGILARVPLAGGAPREILEGCYGADWTPDGQSLTVIRRNPTGTGGENHLEFPAGNVIYEPAGWVTDARFSPNGEFLAFADHVSAGDDGRIVITDVKGNHKVSSSFYSTVWGAAWTPNGKEIWYSAAPGGAARSIYALDLSGKERLVYRAPGGLTLHDLSPTGLVLLTSDKTRITLSALPPGETRERSLSWFDWSLVTDMSPDGKTVVFSETGEAVGADYSMYLRKTDGSPAVRLGDGGFGFLSPDRQWVLATDRSPPSSCYCRRELGSRGTLPTAKWTTMLPLGCQTESPLSSAPPSLAMGRALICSTSRVEARSPLHRKELSAALSRRTASGCWLGMPRRNIGSIRSPRRAAAIQLRSQTGRDRDGLYPGRQESTREGANRSNPDFPR